MNRINILDYEKTGEKMEKEKLINLLKTTIDQMKSIQNSIDGQGYTQASFKCGVAWSGFSILLENLERDVNEK